MPVCQFMSSLGEERPTSTVCDDGHMPRSRRERPINAKGFGRSAGEPWSSFTLKTRYTCRINAQSWMALSRPLRSGSYLGTLPHLIMLTS